ncbi:MAG: GGDEF domain-containing protein [Sandaracinaceae bacterium]|nr:GGDEF domain-containing protein [Sandaracinaceae bacterium]
MSGASDDDDDDPGEGTAVLSLASLGLPPRSAATPFLILLAGEDAGKMVRVETEVLIGRSPKAGLRLTGEGVSRLHARFVRREDGTYVEDLGSTNGTLVNGVRLTGPAVLRDGDKIQIGASFLIKFSLQDALEQSFQQQLYEAALRDPLTKAFNRRALNERLETELAHLTRHGTELAVTLFDLDHFKRVNDTFGHLAGDHVLRTFAHLVSSMTRREDFFARYGGEEFVMLCRSTPLDHAKALAERIRVAVERERVVYSERVIPVTVSIGIASAWPRCTSAEVIGVADAALYAAKNAGRNQVVAYVGGA